MKRHLKMMLFEVIKILKFNKTLHNSLINEKGVDKAKIITK